MLYLDSSAIVKLVARERETVARVEAIRRDSEVVSSSLAGTEVVRAARRAGTRAARARSVLDGIAFVPVDDGILREAGDLRPRELRTPDALHLATALSLGDDLACLVTYDARVAEAAATAGLDVRAPGATG